MTHKNATAGRGLDEQEQAIARALIRNPRISDNRLGEENGIPIRTVSRKRTRMEREGLLRYYAEVDMSASGTGYFQCRHLYIIRFRVGISVRRILDQISSEPNVATVFTRSVYESHVAEIEGRVALVMILEGQSDADIVERFQTEIVPSLEKTHGKDAIEDVDTIRILQSVRLLHNYLPTANMERGRIRDDWSSEALFVA
ncbi:MAG: Lrp/AsnC family transcriptional regulator [Candidatus Dadabacteria bacterium]|nr:MAG: Lrp/AsnC family transcriptional regulator [Candidatus Dadabacteria bacterium]